MNILKDGMKKKMEKGESLRMGISTVSDNLKNIRKGLRITWQRYITHCTFLTTDYNGLLISDDTGISIESAKNAASASNSTVSKITQRLRNISQEVQKLTLTDVSVNIDDILVDSDQTCEYSMAEKIHIINYIAFINVILLNWNLAEIISLS